MSFISFIIFSLGFGRARNRWFKHGIKRDFITVILPNGVKCLRCQLSYFAKFSSSFNVSVYEFSDQSNIIVVSSANCTNLKSVLLILIPLIFSLFLIFIANISAQRIEM